jgi:hypothetical protein
MIKTGHVFGEIDVIAALSPDFLDRNKAKMKDAVQD